MSYQFPKFSSGNKAFASALNKVVAVMRTHGVNPAGRPGWVSTKDGWMPPFNFGGSSDVTLNWDLIRADTDDEWTIYNPVVTYSREDVESSVTITNDSFTLVSGDWVLAKMSGSMASFEISPTIEIVKQTTWNGFPSAYYFGASNPFEWESTYIPIWKITATDEGESMLLSENVYGTKQIGNYPALVYSLFDVPGSNRNRIAPTLI